MPSLNPGEKLLIGFRGIGKTTLVKNYVGYRYLLDPTEKIKVVSDCLTNAQKMARNILNFIRRSPVLAPWAPKGRVAITGFDLAGIQQEKDPSLSCVGIDGSITSTRATLVIIDDGENLTNTATEPLREELLWKLNECQAVLHPVGRRLRNFMALEKIKALPYLSTQLLLIGTFQHPRSIYVPTDDQEHPLSKVQRYLFPAIRDGIATCPGRFPLSDLDERKKSPAKFALDFLCDPSLIDAEAAIIQLDRIPQKELAPKFLYGFVDAAQGGDCETVAVFAAPVGSELYIHSLTGWKYDTPTWAAELVRVALSIHAVEIFVEAQAPALVDAVRMAVAQARASIMVRGVTTGHRSKHARIAQTLESMLNSGKVVFHPAILADARTKAQLQGLTADRLPDSGADRLDALAMAVDRFSKSLGYSSATGLYKSARI